MAQETPLPAADERVTGFVETGYRWRTDPGGSLNSNPISRSIGRNASSVAWRRSCYSNLGADLRVDDRSGPCIRLRTYCSLTYRCVVDLGSGPKLLRSESAILDPKSRLFDRVETRASNWGGDPYSTLHVSANKQHLYDFTAYYSNIAYFNYLPLFADPLLNRGILLNQRSFDIRRRMANLQLELLPGNWFVPYLAYERSSGQGRGINTFVSDMNEYPVPTLISDVQNHYRGGVRFQLPRLNLTIEQGGTTFKDDQSLYENVHNQGNCDTPFFGQTLRLSSLIQAYGIRSDSVHTRVSGTGAPTHWLNLSGDFLYSRPRTQSSFQQANTGNFVLSSEALAFTAQQFLLSAEASMPRETATLGAELLANRRTRIILSFVTDRLDNDGSSAAENTLVAGTALPARSPALTSSLRNEYSHLAADALFDVTTKLSIRAGYWYVWGESQTWVLPLQGLATLADGRLRRNVASGGFSSRPFSRLTLNADVEGAASARAYFRTSLNDYQRGGVRARYQVSKDIHLTAD